MPYTLDANDMRFATPQGFNSGDQFYTYLRDSFDQLYAEGDDAPKMLSIGLHCRLVGRPGRAAALGRFLDYVANHDRVWVATRLAIARHWVRHHPPAGGYVPSQLSRALFMERFGGLWEHSPWVAEQTHAAGLTTSEDSAEGLHRAMCGIVRRADESEKLALLRAHPDLAGKLAAAKMLTAESTAEQASAGLDHLTFEEKQRFTQLNSAYVERFGFPFIIAVRDNTKASIMAAFEKRLSHSPDIELSNALTQVERIVAIRLADLL